MLGLILLILIAAAVNVFLGFTYGVIWAVKDDARVERMRAIRRRQP